MKIRYWRQESSLCILWKPACQIWILTLIIKYATHSEKSWMLCLGYFKSRRRQIRGGKSNQDWCKVPQIAPRLLVSTFLFLETKYQKLQTLLLLHRKYHKYLMHTSICMHQLYDPFFVVADFQWKWWWCADGGDNCMLAFAI